MKKRTLHGAGRRAESGTVNYYSSHQLNYMGHYAGY